MSPSISVKQTLGKRLKKLSLFSLEKRGRESWELLGINCHFYLFVLKEARGGGLGIHLERRLSRGWRMEILAPTPCPHPPGDIWRRLGTFLVMPTGGGGRAMLPASSENEPGMLLNVLQGATQRP